jgi:hypothetical protein
MSWIEKVPITSVRLVPDNEPSIHKGQTITEVPAPDEWTLTDVISHIRVASVAAFQKERTLCADESL